ncbi:hypothetical protein [Butyrivibrio sp. AC2005]|uniref:hypothetical protein n=1 Tax=Butyrivibrio sp. AC2005 TaxID=1280672 RepID=UPI000401A98C|nr:hypothetical protein [Butyrivibrio sp. AC2005]
MAKVLRRLLNEVKDKMTDEEFFTSKVMKQHFESIIEGVCKTFHRRIAIKIINEGSSVAYTNGDTITINLNNGWIKKQASRLDKYYIIVGIILHECGHILYTDFKLMEKCFDALTNNRLFPIIDYSETLSECFDDNMGNRFLGIYQALDNCVEDGHIEKRVIRYVPGYGECLMKVRKLHLAQEGIKTYEEQLKEAEEAGKDIDRIGTIMSLVLIYAKFGVDNAGDMSDDLTELFYGMTPHVDAAVNTNNATLRKREVNIIFDMLIDFISDEIKKEKEKEQPEPEEETSDPSEEDEKDTSEEDTEPDSDEEDAESDTDEEERDEPSSPSVSEDDGDSEEEGSSEEAEESERTMSKEEMEKALEETLAGLGDLCDEMSDKTEHSDTPENPVSDEDEITEAEGNAPDEGMDFDPSNEDGPEEWDLSYLEDLAAEEELAIVTKKQIVKAMTKNADDTRKGRTDKYPSIQKYAEPDDEAIAMFTSQHEELDRIARRVKKNLDKVIKERQKGDRLNGLYTGKQLDSSHAYRKDKRIFANKILPEDVPDMEVCVLVDCSGSMCCRSRMDQSRKCAYITWKFCQFMGIPCSVYGHTTDACPERHVVMTCVAHPDNLDKDDDKRIFMLRPEYDNRDGWAVNFCAEALNKSSATSRMLLIISDGLPAAEGYGETLGKRDCQEVVKRYRKKGISVITAGIDDCAGDIKSLYVDGIAPKDAAKFLDYSDMTQLPKAFATIIKKELL